MRDDRNKWPPLSGHERTNLTGENVDVRLVQVGRQTVISGAVGDCLSLCGAEHAVTGEPKPASGDFYALRQRRDRLLVVNGPALVDGWNSDFNVAVSDMTAAYVVISLTGPNVEQVIATGTEIASGPPSPSVSRLWHGFGILIYKHTSNDAYRMHVRTAHLEAVWEMIDRQVSALAGVSATQPPYEHVTNGIDNVNMTCMKAG